MQTFCTENFTLESMSERNHNVGRFMLLHKLVIYTVINHGKILFKAENIFIL